MDVMVCLELRRWRVHAGAVLGNRLTSWTLLRRSPTQRSDRASVGHAANLASDRAGPVAGVGADVRRATGALSGGAVARHFPGSTADLETRCRHRACDHAPNRSNRKQ